MAKDMHGELYAYAYLHIYKHVSFYQVWKCRHLGCQILYVQFENQIENNKKKSIKFLAYALDSSHFVSVHSFRFSQYSDKLVVLHIPRISHTYIHTYSYMYGKETVNIHRYRFHTETCFNQKFSN